jgi:hypothetical protein
MSDERAYCSERSLADAEPMAGTADRVDVWLLLEYLPVWSAKATTDNALAATTRDWLAGLANEAQQRGLQPRLQFIRQPEIERTGATLLVAADGVLHRVDAPDYSTLSRMTLAAVLAAPAVAAPEYFVCTNGQRDLCCARFGLPTYAALRERVGARVWQTTHVGGHRFAPNVLVLPQAALYGRVQPGDVATFVATVESDRLAARWLRGRTCHAPEVQAAEAALVARGIDALGALTIEPVGDGALRVRFGVNTVVVRPGPAREVLTSCGDEQRKTVVPWIVRLDDDR